MALRQPLAQLTKRALPTQISKFAAAPTSALWQQKKNFAMPVTQDATGSKGPTAMVFMNMGGPSTTDEVGDFLSRLFVSMRRTACVSSY
jgi:ferrochelatase